MRRITTALKWFAYGIVLGVLFAPRSGQETRRQLIQSASDYVSRLVSKGGEAAQQFGGQARERAQAASDQVRQTGETAAQQSDRITQ